MYFLLLIQALWWLSYWALSFLEVISERFSIVKGMIPDPEPVPVYELIPGFQYGVYGFSFSFILLAVACLYRKTLPFVVDTN